MTVRAQAQAGKKKGFKCWKKRKQKKHNTKEAKVSKFRPICSFIYFFAGGWEKKEGENKPSKENMSNK